MSIIVIEKGELSLPQSWVVNEWVVNEWVLIKTTTSSVYIIFANKTPSKAYAS